MPLSKLFSWVLALSLIGKTQGEYVFAKKAGGMKTAKAYLKKLIDEAGIQRKVTPGKSG